MAASRRPSRQPVSVRLAPRRAAALLVVLSLALAACRGDAPGRPGGGQGGGTAAPTAAATRGSGSGDAPAASALAWKAGRNDDTITLDGIQRRYIIHVPKSYKAGTPMPAVIVFHGTGQSGDLFWDVSGWKEKGEAEGILTVFPTANTYDVPEDGGRVPKWNDVGLDRKVKAGTVLLDDVAFVRAILERLETTFTVDMDRVYATGFSSGSGFTATRLLFQMDDTFAAFGIDPGSLTAADASTPGSRTGLKSVYIVAGTDDEKVFNNEAAGYLSRNFPKTPEAVMADPYIAKVYGQWFKLLGLDPVSYTYEASKAGSGFGTLTFRKSTTGGSNELLLRFVNGMPHWYPWPAVKAKYGFINADIFWEFFQRHPFGK